MPGTEVLHIKGYTTYHNIGASMRGTALLTKEGIQLDNIAVTPTGRAMTATFQDVLLVNVYAPSGTAMRAAREQFYNSELSPLLRTDHKQIICGGDFNYMLHPSDVLGHFTRSYALAELVKGFNLRDTWTQDPARPTFTFHHAYGASRIDRFYLTPEQSEKKNWNKNFTGSLHGSLYGSSSFKH
jgi:hypothetical protein